MEIDKDKTGPLFVQEPEIKVGIMEEVRGLTGRFNGPFRLQDGRTFVGSFAVQAGEDGMIFTDQTGARIDGQVEMCFSPTGGATFSLADVTIGIQFHWERKQQQTFRGDLLLRNIPGGTLTAVNRLRLEAYLTSVISSEMSAAAPLEMLKAHAIASRSWLMAMLRRQGEKGVGKRITARRLDQTVKSRAGTAGRIMPASTSAPMTTVSAIRASRKSFPTRRRRR